MRVLRCSEVEVTKTLCDEFKVMVDHDMGRHGMSWDIVIFTLFGQFDDLTRNLTWGRKFNFGFSCPSCLDPESKHVLIV